MSQQYDHDGPLYEHDMERLAHGRIDEGRQTQRLHRTRDGLCVSCGRESPCDAYQQAGEIVARYTAFLATDPEPARAPNSVTMARPYVFFGGRLPLNSGPW